MRVQIRLLMVVVIAITALTVILHGYMEDFFVSVAEAFKSEPEIINKNMHGPYTVERVTDGDTIVVNIDGKSTKVRLIGIDTPESVHPDAEKNTAYGETVSAYVKELLDGAKVYLEYDIERTDKYGRTLAYVYLDETEMLNRMLLREGNAVVMTIQPNSKYSDEFYQTQVAAREAKIGLWADD